MICFVFRQAFYKENYRKIMLMSNANMNLIQDCLILTGLSQFPLPMTLTIVACATALVLFGISLSLLKKLREPINIDVPEFKEVCLLPLFKLEVIIFNLVICNW